MKLQLTSEADTKAFGAKLGATLKGGECIELVGDVGAGKTTFTKGVAAGMGITETIQSPTFTISRVYNAPNGVTLYHYDFYRLNDAGIMANELDEAIRSPGAVVIIEWGEAVRDVRPADALVCTFSSPSETERVIECVALGAKSSNVLKELQV